MKAMFDMKKLDLAALQAAADQAETSEAFADIAGEPVDLAANW